MEEQQYEQTVTPSKREREQTAPYQTSRDILEDSKVIQQEVLNDVVESPSLQNQGQNMNDGNTLTEKELEEKRKQDEAAQKKAEKAAKRQAATGKKKAEGGTKSSKKGEVKTDENQDPNPTEGAQPKDGEQPKEGEGAGTETGTQENPPA